MKTTLAFILLVLFSVNTQAQIFSSWGFKLGAGASTQTWTYESDNTLPTDFITGLTARVFLDILDIPFFKIEGEGGYIRKGTTVELPSSPFGLPFHSLDLTTVDISLDYLNISLLAKFKLGTLYLLAGPQYNVLIKKEITERYEAVFDEFRESNLGYSIGAGIELGFLPLGVLAEYRFEGDFNDNYELSTIDIKNYSHVLMAGIQF